MVFVINGFYPYFYIASSQRDVVLKNILLTGLLGILKTSVYVNNEDMKG
jgi:hypothetical protein